MVGQVCLNELLVMNIKMEMKIINYSTQYNNTPIETSLHEHWCERGLCCAVKFIK